MMLLALWLAAPGMVAFEGSVEQRLRLGAAELNAKAPFDDGVAILVRAAVRKRTLALHYRLAGSASLDATRRLLAERSCTDHPIGGMISDSGVVVTAFFATPRGKPAAMRIDARSCRTLRSPDGDE
ncbi:MAG: hypothetical protein QOJ91_1141 [Sphingomonadales bacterium]|jgi:hypothetical protein|nr:hypothetical protein [Sphingomonadales bacterium]